METTTAAGSKVLARLTRNDPAAHAPDQRGALLLENLSEVRKIARRIHVRLPRHIPFDDLVHEGVLGFFDAVEKYDPTKNIPLRSYASFRIRGAILDSLRGLDWGPRHLRRQARRIELASNELASQLGRVPSELEIAVQLGFSLNDLQQILKELHCLRVETELELISKQEMLISRRNGSYEDPFDACARAETRRALAEAIETLVEKERRALILYYFEERTMKEIGRALKVGESRVSQIIAAALRGLRACMEKN